jgi:hypothetical protein
MMPAIEVEADGRRISILAVGPCPRNEIQPGWKPLAFKTEAEMGEAMNLMRAFAGSGALLAATTPAANNVKF